LNKFENERIISFVPPDGEFELISYRLDVKVKPLFNVDVVSTLVSSTKMEFKIKVRSNFKQKSTANNVEVFIPIPDDSENHNFKCQTGSLVYSSEKDALHWTLKSFPG